MTDKVTTQTAVIATLPDGTEIAVDQLPTGELVQIVKLYDGAENSTNAASVSPAGALKVDPSAVTQPVSAVALPLPAGAATSANQATEIAALATLLAELQQKLEPNDPVSVSASALPAGAATEATLAARATEATLALIKTAVETIDNFIIGARGLVTEDNSSAILTELGQKLEASDLVGLATAAKQDLLLAELQLKADLTETQPVSVAKTDQTMAAPTTAAVGVASAAAVAAQAGRKGLHLRNTSTAGQRISLGFDGNAAVLDSGVTLYPDDVFEMDAFDFTTGAVAAIASAAAARLSVQEST